MDWTVVPELPQRFENLVASHLLKWVQFEEDTKARDLELRYFRDVDRREVDFVIVEGKAAKQTPILMVECTWNDTDVDSSLIYLKNKFPPLGTKTESASPLRYLC